MKIITTPDARLREKSEKVRQIDDEVLGIIAKMREISVDWEKDHPYELSAAMAAPQIGVNKRIIIVRDDMEDKKNADGSINITEKQSGREYMGLNLYDDTGDYGDSYIYKQKHLLFYNYINFNHNNY